MEVQPIFKLKVRGTYHAYRENGRGKEVLNYPITTFRLPEDKLEKAISILKTHGLPAILRKKDPRFIKVREVIIEDTIPETEGASFMHLPEDRRIRLMGRKMLTEFIKVKKLPVVPEIYPSIMKLRDAVQLAIESPAMFLKKDARTAQASGALSDLLRLNPELTDGDGMGESSEQAQAPVEPTKAELVEKAKSMGIDVKSSWTKAVVQEKIAELEEAARILNAETTTPDDSIIVEDADTSGVTVTEGDEVKTDILNAL